MPVARLIKTTGPGTSPEKVQIELDGPRNGANLVFTLPETFDAGSLKVYRNGVREMRDQLGACDYVVSESGGAGTGFDTITFLDRPPIANENLFADYVPAAP